MRSRMQIVSHQAVNPYKYLIVPALLLAALLLSACGSAAPAAEPAPAGDVPESAPAAPAEQAETDPMEPPADDASNRGVPIYPGAQFVLDKNIPGGGLYEIHAATAALEDVAAFYATLP